MAAWKACSEVKPSRRHQTQTPRRAGTHARLRVAAEAARILAEEGVLDYHLAKRKAAERLMEAGKSSLPTNEEVEQALHDHLNIFQSGQLAERIARHRRVAIAAMRFLNNYSPRAVGNVITGIIPPHAEIQIHLCADNPEQIALTLMEHNIPYDESKRRLRFGGDRYREIPTCRFTAENTIVELVVFSPSDFREPPLNPIDGKPVRRVALKEMEHLATPANQ